jgi:hypothetical protein
VEGTLSICVSVESCFVVTECHYVGNIYSVWEVFGSTHWL